MKLNKNYILKDFAGDHVLVKQDANSIDFSKVITLNELGVFIYQCLEKDEGEEEIVKSVLNEYNAEEQVVRNDVHNFLNKLIEMGIVNE